MDLPGNSDLSQVNINNAEETVVMNLTGFYDFDEESLIIMRTGVTNKRQILDKIKYASQYAGTRLYHDANSSTSSELEKRLLLVNIQGVDDIPNGHYLLYRMQEKKTESNRDQNPVEVQNSVEYPSSVEIIYESGMQPSTVNINSNESHSSAQPNLVLNNPVSNQNMPNSSSSESDKKSTFQTLMRLMEPLKKTSSFTFHDVKQMIRQNHIEISSRQLTTLLFRAQKKKILGKLPGDRRYKFRSN